MANLVIVESPAKANTIKGYLGANYRVVASKGHIRDLPKSTLGIDVDNGFKPHYINIRGKGDVIKELKKEAKSASRIFLATDPDREGEAISWHIATELGIPDDRACRVTFNEITKNAVKSAIKSPRKIDIDLVNSQQARRILDRMVGFSLSEILWKNVKSGLSGGRVQSVAARIVTEREREIRDFVPQEYWTVDAVLTDGKEKIETRLAADSAGKIKLSDENEAERVLEKLRSGTFRVLSVKRQARERVPAPPFTTSTMQQEASKRLGFQTQRIMKVAQELYDGLNLGEEFGGVQGLITYMRTDSLRVSDEAKAAATDFIRENYGEKFLPKSEHVYKTNANAQDAHEAIRPSNVAITPKLVRKLLTPDQYKLYKLIWERFVASGMASAVLDTVTLEIENSGYIFRAGGYTVRFRGYMSVMDEEEPRDGDADVEKNLSRIPDIAEGAVLEPLSLNGNQHFTEPPARYTEASLIRFLEENGIGRPSTYAPIISILLSRNYVRRDGKSLVATPLGEVTTQFMRENFPEITDYEFTATMENQLDSIARAENTVEGVISGFWGKFTEELSAVNADSEKNSRLVVPPEESNVVCEYCGRKMVYRNGRFGKFLACPGYPECRNTKAVDKDGNPVEKQESSPRLAGFRCELCGAEMVERTGRYGVFYACSNYPQCKNTKQKTTDTGVLCPRCGSHVVARHGRGKSLFYSCEKYPECDFSSWDMPLPEKCPQCGGMLYYRKSRKSIICKEPGCGYKREAEIPEAPEAPEAE